MVCPIWRFSNFFRLASACGGLRFLEEGWGGKINIMVDLIYFPK